MRSVVLASQIVVLVLSSLLFLSVAHKSVVLAANRTAEEPLLNTNALVKRYARSLIFTAAAVETCILALLLTDAFVGLIAAGALLAIYGLLLTRIPFNERCGCFGEIAPTSTRIALMRNGILAALAGGSSVIAATHNLADGLFRQWLVGTALLIGVLLLVASRLIDPVSNLWRSGSERTWS